MGMVYASGCIPVATSRAAASPVTGAATSSQIREVNSVTPAIMNGELM